MKRLIATFALVATIGTLSAQEPEKSNLSDAHTKYNIAVAEQRVALEEARAEERSVVEAVKKRLGDARDEYNAIKRQNNEIIEEHTRIIKEAKATVAEAKARYKHEATLAKQEIAAAKAQTKAIEHQHKSAVSSTKADITRIKAEQ